MNPACSSLCSSAPPASRCRRFSCALSETGPTATAFWRVALAVPVLWILSPSRPRAAVRRIRVNGPCFLPRALPSPAISASGTPRSSTPRWRTRPCSPTSPRSSSPSPPGSSCARGRTGCSSPASPPRSSASPCSCAPASATRPPRSLGDALGVVTAMFYAGYILAVKGLRDRGETTLHLMAVTSTITADPACRWRSRPRRRPAPRQPLRLANPPGPRPDLPRRRPRAHRLRPGSIYLRHSLPSAFCFSQW